MPLTPQETDELELLKLKKRKLELTLQLSQQTSTPQDSGAIPLPQDSGAMPLPQDSGAMPLPQDSGAMPLPQDSGAMPLPQDSGFTQPLTAQENSAIGPRGELSAPSEVRSVPSTFPIGATIGGALGAAAGVGTPASIALAGVGAAGGEAVDQLVRRGLGLPSPDTSLAAGARIAKEGAFGALGEAGGRVILAGGGKVLSHFSKKVTPEAADAISFINERLPPKTRGVLNPLRYVFGADKKKLALLPAEATADRTLDILENISEASLIGGSKISEFKQNRNKFLGGLADDIIKGFGDVGSTDDVGDLIVGTIEGRLSANRLITKGMYNQVERLTEGLTKTVVNSAPMARGTFGEVVDIPSLRQATEVPIFSTKALKAWARPRLAVALEAGGIDPKANGTDLLSTVTGLNDNIGFSAMQKLRTALRTRADEFSISNKTAPAIGVANRLKKIINEVIQTSLKKHSPEALGVLNEADKLYAIDSKNLNSEFLRSLVKKADERLGGAAETLAPKVFKKNNITRIREVRKAVGGKDSSAWKTMQAWNTGDLFAKATKKTGDRVGELTGDSLKEAMFGRTGIGRKAMGNIYTKSQLRTLGRLANALSVVQAKQAEGTGRMFIQLSQGGALLSMPFASPGKISKTAATILLGPAVLARAFTNPKIANILINGVEAGVKSKLVAGALGRFVTDLTNYEIARSGEGTPPAQQPRPTLPVPTPAPQLPRQGLNRTRRTQP